MTTVTLSCRARTADLAPRRSVLTIRWVMASRSGQSALQPEPRQPELSLSVRGAHGHNIGRTSRHHRREGVVPERRRHVAHPNRDDDVGNYACHTKRLLLGRPFAPPEPEVHCTMAPLSIRLDLGPVQAPPPCTSTNRTDNSSSAPLPMYTRRSSSTSARRTDEGSTRSSNSPRKIGRSPSLGGRANTQTRSMIWRSG